LLDVARHYDVWLFRQDFELADVVLQEFETIDAKLPLPEEILELAKNGDFIPSSYLNDLFEISN
jgi:hypothetical protein